MHIEFITLSESARQSKLLEIFYPRPILWPQMAAITPKDVKISVQDEHLRRINFDSKSDIVGISVTTSIANRAYITGREFKKRGKKVVYGGPHITAISKYDDLKDEPFKHGRADTIFIGDAEDSWPKYINDLKSGTEQKVYFGEPFSFNRPIFPKMEYSERRGLSTLVCDIQSIESSRGCVNHCEFCTANGVYRTKKLEELIIELNSRKVKTVSFTDANIAVNKERLILLIDLLTEYEIYWSAGFSLQDLSSDLIEKLGNSTCKGVIIGLESVNQDSLIDHNKSFNHVSEYENTIKELKKRGLIVVGSFVFGLEHDTVKIFRDTLDFMVKACLDDATFHILVPYPGTKLFDRYKEEERLIYTNFPEDWSHYNRNEATFRPKRMSPKQLVEGQRKIMRDFYSLESIYSRMKKINAGLLMANIVKYIKTR